MLPNRTKTIGRSPEMPKATDPPDPAGYWRGSGDRPATRDPGEQHMRSQTLKQMGGLGESIALAVLDLAMCHANSNTRDAALAWRN